VIVRLTVHQSRRVRALLEAAGACPATFEWWDRDCSVASKHRVDIVMPAIGWRSIEGIMFDHCFDERGFRARERVRSTDLNALKTIRRALNAREHHPALFNRGAIGLIAELIPAWRFPAADASGRCYSPYPVDAMDFVVLAPESRTVRTKQSTLWTEALRPIELPLLDPRQHYRFSN
jgi:hypothetical protein